MAELPRLDQEAPELNLAGKGGGLVTLADFRGKNLVLAFYPADWSPVCTSELSLIQETLDQIRDYNAEVVGVSCDTLWSHATWAKQLGITFPLLSDFWPHGEGARRYGVFRDDTGLASRALFFIDGEGLLRDSWVAENPDIAPGLNLIMNTLAHLDTASARSQRETTHAR